MKIMHTLWQDYQARTYGGLLDPTGRQYREIRQAFYAGAIETMDTAARLLSDNNVNTKADEQVLESIRLEAVEFMKEIGARVEH